MSILLLVVHIYFASLSSLSPSRFFSFLSSLTAPSRIFFLFIYVGAVTHTLLFLFILNPVPLRVVTISFSVGAIAGALAAALDADWAGGGVECNDLLERRFECVADRF